MNTTIGTCIDRVKMRYSIEITIADPERPSTYVFTVAHLLPVAALVMQQEYGIAKATPLADEMAPSL